MHLFTISTAKPLKGAKEGVNSQYVKICKGHEKPTHSILIATASAEERYAGGPTNPNSMNVVLVAS
jgi:hypothetical protein